MGIKSLVASWVLQDSQNDLGLTIDLPAGTLSAARFRKLPTDAPIRKANTASIGSGFPENQANVDDQVLHREIFGGIQRAHQLYDLTVQVHSQL